MIASAARVTPRAYYVPSMDDVRAVKANGYRVASLFAGCGGSSLGYRINGFRVVYANEFVEAARESYRANADRRTIVDDRDVRDVSADDLLTQIGLKRGDLDVLDGSPPCASFAISGTRDAAWGKTKKCSDTKQRTDDLFFEFARLVEGVQPRVFVAENVAGLVAGRAKGYFFAILTRLRACGYRVACRVVDAQWLGVPQIRKRAIFVGVREDHATEPRFPRPLSYRVILRDAFRGLTTRVVRRRGSAFTIDDDEAPSIVDFSIEQQYRELRCGGGHKKRFNLTRPSLSMPSYTLSATAGNVGAASVCHPTEPRKYSVNEAKRVCSFPDDFVLAGSYQQRIERLGRAVPPLMMAAIAREVQIVLDEAKR